MAIIATLEIIQKIFGFHEMPNPRPERSTKNSPIAGERIPLEVKIKLKIAPVGNRFGFLSRGLRLVNFWRGWRALCQQFFSLPVVQTHIPTMRIMGWYV